MHQAQESQSNLSETVELISVKDTNSQARSVTIGAFREKESILSELPESISALRSAGLEWRRFTLQPDAAHLNHGAFGAVPAEFQALESRLRSLAEANPSFFYDKLCLPLVRESVQEAEDFFGGAVVLQPNCSMALQSVLKQFTGDNVAVLEPIYGATRKLVSSLFSSFVTVEPGMFCEDSAEITACLDAAFAEQPFKVLVADRVTSQTGRLLPMEDVVNWCKENSVISVVDGTQDFVFDYAVWPDYFVMSTHKWLGNVKTCAIIRTEKGVQPPPPVCISFGYPDPVDSHLWTGMLDYIPYIMLAKVIRVYRAHGRDMVQYSSELLQRGLQILRSFNSSSQPPTPVLTASPPRVMALVEVFRLVEEEDLQEALERYGVFVSVKRLDKKKYLRISAWTYNTEADFFLLRDFLKFNLHLDFNNDHPSSALSVEDRSNRKRSQLLAQFHQSLDMEDRLFGQLQDAGFFFRAEALRHPLVFYFGHVAVFYVNKLVLGGYLSCEQRIDAELESLCAVGVDEMAWDDLWLGNWDQIDPSQYSAKLSALRAYRGKVRALISSIIQNRNIPLELPISPSSIWWILLMGQEHSRIHLETSSAILTQLSLQYFKSSQPFPLQEFESDRNKVPQNGLVRVGGGSVRPGRSLKGTEYYGWDNEFGNGEEVILRDFEVSSMLVSNAEYAAFVEDGGYSTRAWWSDKGWGWAKGRSKPLLWITETNGSLKYRALSSITDMPYNWPAAVCNYEAEAFCNWKSSKLGKKVRMISYTEWLLLAIRSSECGEAVYNSNFSHGASPCAVDRFGSAIAEESQVVFDVCGNLWQHSRSVLSVLPEFAVHPLYDDFTLPTIDGEHNFILGGSFMSAGKMASPEARFGFRRHFFQFAGIRYVVSDNEEKEVSSKVFDGDVAMQLMEHYFDFNDPVRLSVNPVQNGVAEFGRFACSFIGDGDSVIVLNGGVGRITVEVALNSKPSSILHTDGTANSLDAFLHIREHSSIRFDRRIEGLITKTETATLSDAQKSALAAAEISVKQVDLFRLAESAFEPRDVAVVDLTMLSAISCPRRGEIPLDLHLLVRPGGRLVVLRPATANRHARDEAVFPGFVRVASVDEDRTITHICRETRRKHRFSVSECLVYERTAEIFAAVDNIEITEVRCLPQYEQAGVLEAYERFHFKFEDIYGIKNFPQACAEVCLEACKRHGVALDLALDCGGGPGRLGIDLAAEFKRAVTYDYASGFVEMAKKYAPANCTALLGDAMSFRDEPLVKGDKFNLIVGANLVDRIPDPSVWVKQSCEMLAPDGLLVIFTPFTWLKDYSDPSKWFGGFRRDAEVVWSLNGAIETAMPDLCLCQTPTHVPFVIPDADGTFQYTYSQCMVFARKANVQSKENFLPDVALNFSSPA